MTDAQPTPRLSVRGGAGLSGAAWLRFLDRTYGGNEFSHGVGRALALAPYAPHAQPDATALTDLIRCWIGAHHD